jgi:peptidoglycan hydrolase FlgJ
MTKLSPTPQIQLPIQVSPVPATADPGMAATAAARPLRPSLAVDPVKIAKSAHDFEAMAIGQLLQPMFDTVNTSKGTFGGGPGE